MAIRCMESFTALRMPRMELRASCRSSAPSQLLLYLSISWWGAGGVTARLDSEPHPWGSGWDALGQGCGSCAVVTGGGRPMCPGALTPRLDAGLGDGLACLCPRPRPLMIGSAREALTKACGEPGPRRHGRKVSRDHGAQGWAGATATVWYAAGRVARPEPGSGEGASGQAGGGGAPGDARPLTFSSSWYLVILWTGFSR